MYTFYMSCFHGFSCIPPQYFLHTSRCFEPSRPLLFVLRYCAIQILLSCNLPDSVRGPGQHFKLHFLLSALSTPMDPIVDTRNHPLISSSRWQKGFSIVIRTWYVLNSHGLHVNPPPSCSWWRWIQPKPVGSFKCKCLPSDTPSGTRSATNGSE